jgi:hypothetical protein
MFIIPFSSVEKKQFFYFMRFEIRNYYVTLHRKTAFGV